MQRSRRQSGLAITIAECPPGNGASLHAHEQSVENFLSGNGDDLHSTILSVQRADLEFQMFMQVRNKVVSAYQEVMKMQM